MRLLPITLSAVLLGSPVLAQDAAGDDCAFL